MKQRWLLMLFISAILPTYTQDESITIIVHGAIGLGANLSSRTISLMKKDLIEDSPYQKNVQAIRENPYLFALSPTGNLGLHKISEHNAYPDAALLFSELYTDLATQYLGPQDTTFYTYGWSALISTKERMKEARKFYRVLRELIKERQRLGKNPKIRLIGYSYGPVMFLNFATIRKEEFPEDTFMIDEIILVGVPITKTIGKLVTEAPFSKVYNIYSQGDNLQRFDVFSGHSMSHKCFKGDFPNITQIELKFTAHLKRIPGKNYPSMMRRRCNQSPGHVELWSFGWVSSYYRKNLYMYPLCGAIFIPFLLHAADQVNSNHIRVDLRPEQAEARVHSHLCHEGKTIPFLSETEFRKLTNKALTYHPENEQYKELYSKLKKGLPAKAYR